jgi:hypothetical protein
VTALYGGMSKGECNRVKVRVRSAMKAQTELEGRYLGGRPPYGYRLADAGPHPNPGKAAEGRRLHRLDRTWGLSMSILCYLLGAVSGSSGRSSCAWSATVRAAAASVTRRWAISATSVRNAFSVSG